MLKRIQSKVSPPPQTTNGTCANTTSCASSSPVTSNRPITPSHIEWTKQLHAYVAWVNSQLRKKPGCRLVTDLRNDFRDGTALAYLLEIVGGTKLDGIEQKPSSLKSKKKNVEKALEFMVQQKMDIQSTSVKDINDGHLKATMRLILAIAKQYKPNTVTKPTVENANDKRTPNYGSLDSRRQIGKTSPNGSSSIKCNNASTIQRVRSSYLEEWNKARAQYQQANARNQAPVYHRPRTIDPKSIIGNKGLSWSSYKVLRNNMSNWSDGDYGDYAGSDSEGSGRCSPELRIQTSFTQSSYSLNERLINGGGEVDGASSVGSPTQSLNKVTLGVNTKVNKSPILNKTYLSPAKSLPCLQKLSDREGYRDYENFPPLAQSNENLSCKQGSKTSEKAVKETNIGLLSGHPNETVGQANREANTVTHGGTSAEDKLVALQSYLQMTSEKCQDLHSNLKKTQHECANLEDVKTNLHDKVVEQDKFLLEMKQEMTKLQLENQSLEARNQDVIKNLEIKEVQITELMRQLNSKDKLIHQQKSQLDDAIRNLSGANKSKACLTSRLVEQDRKIALLEQSKNHKTPMREELQIVRDALQSLRSSFKSNEPQHHTIDTLEQSFALLMERLHLADMQKISNGQLESKKLNFDSTGDPRRFPLSSYQSYCLQKFENNNNSTKVVYFTEKTLTPFMSSIPKRLGDIKLTDFKTMFDRQGNFRYHFKSLDPEYGMVKEEIMHDDDVLPGWEGKIIAWVEEDHG